MSYPDKKPVIRVSQTHVTRTNVGASTRVDSEVIMWLKEGRLVCCLVPSNIDLTREAGTDVGECKAGNNYVILKWSHRIIIVETHEHWFNVSLSYSFAIFMF